MFFDPIHLRQKYLNSLLDYELSMKIAESDPIGNFGRSGIVSTVDAWLVNLKNEIAPVLPRSLDWLTYGIDHNEDVGDPINFHKGMLLEAKGIGLWMLNNTNGTDVWEAATKINVTLLNDKEVWPKGKWDAGGWDDHMALAFQAEEYEAAITLYEASHKVKRPSLSGVLSPRGFAYALCLQKVHACYSPADLLTAGQLMLTAHLEESWVSYGQWICAAKWLKIVYWHANQQLTPQQTILKAYDHMPSVSRPEWAK
jgi:hypothetical protein